MKTPSEIISSIRYYNEWRRGTEGHEQPNATELGEDLDNICILLETSLAAGGGVYAATLPTWTWIAPKSLNK
jgi:hypothetical protein